MCHKEVLGKLVLFQKITLQNSKIQKINFPIGEIFRHSAKRVIFYVIGITNA